MKRRKNFELEIVLTRIEIAKLDREKDAATIKTLRDRLGDLQRAQEGQITDDLIAKAQSYGIELPLPSAKKHWWWDDIDYAGNDFRNYLTDTGKAGAKKLIQEEWRKSVTWWIATFISILTALTGLVGAIIGAIALWKK